VIDPDDFRKVLSHFGSGVTVVTTCDADKRPTGLTCSAFASVSLDPPLILVCVDHKAQSFPALREGGRFAVNILRADQEALSRRFATSKILDKFDGVAHTVSDLGLPLLDNALAHLECTTINMHVEGDHTIVIGRVERVSAPGGEPLLYFRGQYRGLANSDTGA
jgi:flavin reductase (DIM6/NTAB) family NADH-FMN oxidoreductase RutF